MDNEIKTAIAEELKAFGETLKSFQTKEDMTKAFEEFKTDIGKKFENQIDKSEFEKLEAAMKVQGETLAALKLNSGSQIEKSLKDLLIENKSELEAMANAGGNGKLEIKTTVKAVQSTSITSDTMAARPKPLPGEIKRGMPYLRDLFQVVNLGSNSHGIVKWYEQASVTNNAAEVTEVRTMPSESAITWVEKTLTSVRLVDWIKIGVDQLKDVDFVLGEVQRLVNRNMRLKENSMLLTKLLAYAKEFVTTGISITEANLIDLIGKCQTQIDTDLLGAATPNYVIANRNDTDKIRFAKTGQGAYVFPQWVMGDGMTNVGSMQVIENPLVTTNTLVVGDFSLGTIYVWDDLIIEIAQVEADKKTGHTTVFAYMRENLRVQDVDKDAFVKVSDVDTTIAAISV